MIGLSLNLALAQSSDSSVVPKKEIHKGLRIGVDVSRLFMSATQRQFRGAEFSLDYNVGKWIAGMH
ncbi:MAG TPA: DUF6048 family protein, partial [Catalimonadaceae bacterium]|nr:DUF6048 family protein [Catalimonadaceae bacterium]